MRPFLRVLLFAVTLVGGVFGAGVNGIVHAAAGSYYVNGNGGVDTSNTTCGQAAPCLTISHAISVASSAPGSTIYIAGASGGFNGVYCEQITIDASLTLQALAPANPPAIDGGGSLPTDAAGVNSNPCAKANGGSESPGHPVLTVVSGALTLAYLTLQQGDASNVGCSGNSCVRGGGGILNNGGTVTLNNSAVKGSVACSGGACATSNGGSRYGGAILNFGTMMLANSVVSGNTACRSVCTGSGWEEYGGGIANFGMMTMTNSTVSGNTTCSGNCAGSAGGIDNNGIATLLKSTVTGNVASQMDNSCGSSCSGGGVAEGGGIATGGQLTLIGSTVSKNSACSPCTIPSSDAYGGGIFQDGSTMALIDSTVSGNIACGGDCPAAFGGGIARVGAMTTTAVVNSTVSENIGCTGSCSPVGGGIFAGSGTVELTNTIVAENRSPGSPDCYGSLGDAAPNPNSTGNVGDNIIGDATGCTFASGTGDQVGTSANPIDPKLGPLQDNGGPTQTMAPLPGSPAFGAGDATTCSLPTLANGAPGPNGLDQRGGVRSSTSCDVGAYDTWGDTHADSISASAQPTTAPGSPVTATATAINVQTATVSTYTGTVHFTSSDGAASLPSDYSFTSGDQGTHTFPVTLPSGGNQTITATDTTYPSVTGSATVGVLPGPPVNLTAAPSGQSGTVVVSWAPPGDYAQAPMSTYANTPISSYTISATCPPPNPVTFNNTGASLQTNITGLTNGTLYTFSVTATSAIGTGAPSATAPATPSKIGSYPPTVPQSPANVSGTRSNASVNLTWTAPPYTLNGQTAGSGWGYRSLETYTVTCSPSCGSQSFWGGATSATVTGLTNGTPYTFQVQAVNSVGPSTASSLSSPVTPATIPDAPTGLNASPSGDGAVALSWTAPGNNGGDGIVSYTVSCSPSCPSASGLTSTGTSTNVTGLTDGTSYTFTVAATNTVGTGASSSPSVAVTPSPPAAGLAVSDSASGILSPGTQVTVTVTAEDASNNTATGYVGTIHFSSTDPNAQLPADYTFTPGDLGSHTFNATVWAPGQETITASDAANGLTVTTSPISVGVSIESGFSVIDVPLQGSITSAAALASSMNDPSQLGAGAIDQIDLADNGGWDSYVPGFSPDLPMGPTQGVLVDNSLNSSGTWVPPGTPYTSAQTVQLQSGWNLVAAPYPYSGVTASEINTEAPSCVVQEVAIWSAGTYQTWVPSDGTTNDLQVPSDDGIWILCQSAGLWTPGSSL